MTEEKWMVLHKGADFKGIGERFNIDPLIARLIRNRDRISDQEIWEYLHADLSMLYSPHLLKDAKKAVNILMENIKKKERIHIIGDYDIDGVQSSYILYKGIQKAGGKVTFAIPHRMTDGYGINESLIDEAKTLETDTIITCDNGIAAIEQIAYAKSLGMKVIVTDHHEVPYEVQGDKKVYLKSQADAIVNPKQEDCSYPFSDICGAVVAFKVILLLFEEMHISGGMEFLENAAFATIGDVMDLKGENRIIVKFGLLQMRQTKNLGMQALLKEKEIDPCQLDPYHIGFVLGPCLNASGRLDTARRSLSLLLAEDEQKAKALATELAHLNEERKSMTEKGIEQAIAYVVKENLVEDKVLVVYLEELHESLAGIVAGRLREKYHRPVFVLTLGEEQVKGSGRSTEEYSMFEEMSKCKELFVKFGGHPMAAGLSLQKEQVIPFREQINHNCRLTKEDMMKKVKIDVPMPLSYVTRELIEQFQLLEPFGKGNTKPVFADKNLRIRNQKVLGKNQNVLKVTLVDEADQSYSGIFFGEAQQMLEQLAQKDTVSVVYYPQINSFRGAEEIQFVLSGIH